MAERPVFVTSEKNYVTTILTEFTFYSGFAKVQKQRCIDSLHEAFVRWHSDEKVLEISSFSKEELGCSLSAFNLTLTLHDGRQVSVENAYQAGKIFKKGGPFLDLLTVTPSKAKMDPRLHEYGPITGFTFEGRSFPTEPESFFYTWLYIKALSEHPELADPLTEYTAFTDIVFNPAKSISCQAKAAAIYVALRRKSEVEWALKEEEFLRAILTRKKANTPTAKPGEAERTTASHLAGLPQAKRSRSTQAVLLPKENGARNAQAPFPANRSDDPFKAPDDPFKAPDDLPKTPDDLAEVKIITHPTFGDGKLLAVKYGSGNGIAEIDFGRNGVKKLSVDWILRSCSFRE